MFTRGRSTPNVKGTERTLIDQLLAGDETAFTCLVNTHHAPLLRFARLFVGDVATAEDVVQETWVAVLNGLGAFEGRSALKTWIYGILANKAKTRAVRDKRTLPFAALSAAELAEAPVDGDRFDASGSWATPPAQWEMDTPERLVLDKEARAVLDEAIASLPDAQRAVLTLRDIEDLDTATICNILAITETNQRVLLHRARARVRAALDRYLLEGTRADL
ncbi:MAG: RNA polymerase sigma factor [Vicinamibacterales bacterium]